MYQDEEGRLNNDSLLDSAAIVPIVFLYGLILVKCDLVHMTMPLGLYAAAIFNYRKRPWCVLAATGAFWIWCDN